MSYNSERDPVGGPYQTGGGARPYNPDCGAGELRGMLQRIADHIANADGQQQSALGDMQTRLASLVDRWPGPPNANSAELWGRQPDSPRDDQLSRNPAHPPRTRDQSAFATRGLGEAPPPLRSAAGDHGYDGWERRTLAPDPATDARYKRRSGARPVDLGDGWDRVSAEALARIYGPATAADLHDLSSQAAAPEAGSRPFSDSDQRVPASKTEAGDRLEARFAEIADRVEQALAQLTPEASAAQLDARLASFEKRIGSALADLATRADVEQLRAVEAHIEELARHIDQAQSRLARLDEIEASLMRLAEQTSDEHVVHLMERQVLSEPRLARLAEAVAEHLVERDAFRGEVGAGMDRLRELYALIEQFVVAQRQSDQQTASALEVIQQAVLNLLDRMEDLEHAYEPAPPAGGDGDGRQGWQAERWDDRTTTEPRDPAQVTDPYGAGVVSISQRTKDRDSSATRDDSGGQAGETRIAGAIAKAELPGHLPPAGSEGSHGGSPVQEGETPESKLPLHKSREDFLAAARRAARKASSDAADAVSARGGGRQRAPGDGGRASGVRPVTGLVVAMLAVVLAVGVGFTTYSLYKDGLSETWRFGRSVWELGGSVRGAGGGAGSESSQPAETRDSGSSRPASGTPPGIIIDNPAGPRPSSPESGSHGPRKLTDLPGGVVDAGLIAAANQAGGNATPAAYTPQGEEDLPGRSRSSARSEQLMPPDAVGPLSLRLAAANGDPSAEFEVAVRLDEGRGIARDLEQAVVWYRRSASRGFAPAQYRLGTLYERGLGVSADRGRAMAWYRSAAEKGNVKAMHNFAVLNASAEFADFETAAHWFGEAAERGLVDSQFNLAVLHETGRGADQDLKQAYKWFALAARGGDKEAARRRDRVRWMLNSGELEAAEALARTWKPLPLKAEVNSVRAAGEAWKHRGKQG